MMKRFLAMLALCGSVYAEDWDRPARFQWGVISNGVTLATTGSLDSPLNEKWIMLQNQSTSRVWLSWGGKTNINAGIISLTQSNSGSTLVIVTNIQGTATNIIGQGGVFLQPYGAAGGHDRIWILNPPPKPLFFLGENTSGAVSYTEGHY
jgi:hypothetical protein